MYIHASLWIYTFWDNLGYKKAGALSKPKHLQFEIIIGYAWAELLNWRIGKYEKSQKLCCYQKLKRKTNKKIVTYILKWHE